MGLFEFAIIIFTAAVLGIGAKLLRQPIVLAYLAAGVVIGSLGQLRSINPDTLKFFSDLGIMFLLFLVGLEINFSSLRLVGWTAAIIGLGQMILTFTIGFGAAVWFGYSGLPAAYIALALSFSSTIIAVKLLSDKREINSLHGKISLGLLLVQDLVAMLILVLLSGMQAGEPLRVDSIFGAVIKGAFLFVLMLWLGRRVIPYLFDKIAHSHELLFLASLAWLFLVAALMRQIGFSIEIAGLLAGMSLANSSEHYEIAGRIRPLRDFFTVIFFVFLGSSLTLFNLTNSALALAVFILVVLVAKPIIVMGLASVFGYRKRTSFMSGLAVAQVSEFSLILMAIGVNLGHVSIADSSLIIAVGVVTIAISTFGFSHPLPLFNLISGALGWFERGHLRNDKKRSRTLFRKPIVLIGCSRTGQSIAQNLPANQLLVIDFDPEVIHRLQSLDQAVLFGDASDPEIFEIANIKAAKLVISTNPDLENNLALVKQLKKFERHPLIIVRAETEAEARMLYEQGADYVLMPHLISGHHLGQSISSSNWQRVLKQLRERDLALMKYMKRGLG